MKKLIGRQKRNLKIVAGAVTCIFTLATAFTGCVAWFSTNLVAKASGLSVSVSVGSTIRLLSCYAIRYDGNYGAIAVNVLNGGASIAMSEYDSIFKDRNVNTPMFLRMEIAGYDTSNDLQVTIPCTGAFKAGNVVEPNLSNVVSAKLMCGLKTGNSVIADNNTWSGDNVHTNEVVASYQGMQENFRGEVGTPFVTGDATKDSSITLVMPAATAFNPTYIVQRQDGNNTVDAIVAYVAFDYYVAGQTNLVEKYIRSYDNDLAEPALVFSSDIQRVTIANGANQ